MPLLRRYILLLLTLLSFTLQAQQYPVDIQVFVTPPYPQSLRGYADTFEQKIQAHFLLKDLSTGGRPFALRFSLENFQGQVIAQTPDYITPYLVNLSPGVRRTLTNIDFKTLLRYENLYGINEATYNGLLPEGTYFIGLSLYDVATGRPVSNKGRAMIQVRRYSPPVLTMPQKGEVLTKKNAFQNILFQWMPRDIAPFMQYEFTLKEVWDLALVPEEAFMSGRLVYQTKTNAPALQYTNMMPILLENKRYVWQVRALTNNPTNPNEQSYFRNNGNSETFYFDLVSNCEAPRMLTAMTESTSAQLRWSAQAMMPNQEYPYKVMYREKGKSWKSQKVSMPYAKVIGLKRGRTYIYKVGVACGLNTANSTSVFGEDSYVYSTEQEFTTTEQIDEKSQVQCGVKPEIRIKNTEPLQDNLYPNTTFRAGDFPVTVLNATGSNGVYSGEGYVKVPYLQDTKIKVVFNGIKLNTERQLIEGKLVTTYDETERNVQFIQEGIGEVFGDKGKKDQKMPFEVAEVQVDSITGRITITGKVDPKTGIAPKVTLPKGRDYVITDSQGKVYQLDESGKVTAKGTREQGTQLAQQAGKGDSKNPPISNKHFKVEWLFNDELANDTNGEIPYKALVKGKTSSFELRIQPADTTKYDFFFHTENGVKVEAESKGEGLYKITRKGAFDFAQEELWVVAKEKKDKKGKKEELIGKCILVHLSPKEVNVALVPTQSGQNLQEAIAQVQQIYEKVGVTLHITTEKPFDISDQLKNGTLPTENEFGDLSTYSPEQNAVIAKFATNRKPKDNTYYIFLVNDGTGNHGYMRLGGQYGFVYSTNARTIAHELGHGIFKLEHPFKGKNADKGKTTALMDYNEGQDFFYRDWKQINDPKVKLYAFQGQGEGEQISDILLLSRFIENIKAHSFKIDYDYSKKELSDETINFLPEVTLRFSNLEDSGFYSSDKIKTTDGDELTLSLWVGKHFNKYFNFDISNEGGLGKIISPDQKSIRYYRYFNNPTSQDKEVLTSRVLETNAQYFNGIIIQVPNKYVTIFENSVLNFANDKERKERWLNALNKNIETENYEELQKYPTLPFSLVGVKARLSLLEKLSKQKLTTSNSFINKIFSSDLDKEILYVTLLNSIINDQNTEQNNELFNRFVSSYFQKIYDQVDDETTRLKLYKAVGRLAASSNQENVKSKFIDIVNSNSFDKHHGALLASILMGLDEKNIIETQTNLLTLLNDNSRNVGGLKRLYNKLESEDQEYFNYYFSKWAKKYYYDQYQELEVILNSINKNGNINQGIDCNSKSIQYFAVNHIALDYINVFDKCGSYPLNCHYLQTIIPNVDTKNQYFFSYGENRKRKECSDNNNKSVIYYKAGKPFSDFVILFFNESYEYANIKKGDVRIVPLFWAENFAAKHHKKLSGQQLTIALETAGILLAATTGGQSITAVKAITITLGASAIGVEIYENDLLKLEGGKDFVESVRLINALVGGAILVKAIGSSIAVVDLQKIKNFFINVPEKALELKKGLNSFLATAKSGIHFTKEALKEIKALLYEVDLQSSFKQIVQGATAKVKNDLKAYIVAANMEYEIASLRYLDALDGQKLLLTPSVVIVDNTLGYRKIGALENVYITVNNDAKKANIGVYAKGEKVVLSLEKEVKISRVEEILTEVFPRNSKFIDDTKTIEKITHYLAPENAEKLKAIGGESGLKNFLAKYKDAPCGNCGEAGRKIFGGRTLDEMLENYVEAAHTFRNRPDLWKKIEEGALSSNAAMREGTQHMLSTFKKNPKKYTPENIEHIDMKFEKGLDDICANCRYDVKFNRENNRSLPLFEEFKSYNSETWSKIANDKGFIQQFKSYLNTEGIEKIEDLSYVINSNKANINEVKQAFKEVFKRNSDEILEIMSPELKKSLGLINKNREEVFKLLIKDTNSPLYNFIKSQ